MFFLNIYHIYSYSHLIFKKPGRFSLRLTFQGLLKYKELIYRVSVFEYLAHLTSLVFSPLLHQRSSKIQCLLVSNHMKLPEITRTPITLIDAKNWCLKWIKFKFSTTCEKWSIWNDNNEKCAQKISLHLSTLLLLKSVLEK